MNGYQFLSAFGIAGALADPTVELKNSNGATLASNDDWQQSALASEIKTRELAPTDSTNPSSSRHCPTAATPRSFAGHNGGTGVGVGEVYNVE